MKNLFRKILIYKLCLKVVAWEKYCNGKCKKKEMLTITYLTLIEVKLQSNGINVLQH